jgi:hypothetical protein
MQIPAWKPREHIMRSTPFLEYDLCDFVTFTLAGIAFALCLYVVV